MMNAGIRPLTAARHGPGLSPGLFLLPEDRSGRLCGRARLPGRERLAARGWEQRGNQEVERRSPAAKRRDIGMIVAARVGWTRGAMPGGWEIGRPLVLPRPSGRPDQPSALVAKGPVPAVGRDSLIATVGLEPEGYLGDRGVFQPALHRLRPTSAIALANRLNRNAEQAGGCLWFFHFRSCVVQRCYFHPA